MSDPQATNVGKSGKKSLRTRWLNFQVHHPILRWKVTPPPGSYRRGGGALGTPGASRLPTMASCDTPRAPLCWERLRKGCPKLATAANGLIFERMASDGKKSNLVHHCRLCACLGGTPLGGGLRPPPLGARGSPAAPEAVATASGGGCPTGWRPKAAPQRCPPWSDPQATKVV